MNAHSKTPAWASNDIGRALISAIIEERPERGADSYKLPSIFGGHREPCEADYRGKPAARLRRLHREWLERELALLDAQFAVTQLWDEDASKALLRTENANELIERVLAETANQKVAA